MGWFLSGKSGRGKGRKGSAKKRGQSARPSWSPEQARLALKAAAVAVAVAAVALSWWYGEAALLDYARERHGGPVGPERVELVSPPAWIAADDPIRMGLRRAVAQTVSEDPLEGKSLAQAAERLGEQPWIRQVRQVRRTGDGRIEVEADYRTPLAVVQASDGYHLVDEEGVRLPRIFMAHQLEDLHLPLVKGVSAAPPSAGSRWRGADIQAGLRLIAWLANEPYWEQIESFDVSERDQRGRPRLILHTDEGQVVWGLPPGQEEAIEPDARIKRDWLRQVAEQRGAIDAGGRVVHLYGGTVQVSDTGQVNRDPGERW